MLQVRLFRPFSADALLRRCCRRRSRRIAVLDRTKEPGAPGEPLYLDVVTALSEAVTQDAATSGIPRIIGGRYGLSSRNSRPAMVKAVFDELTKDEPKNHFTDRHQRRRHAHQPDVRSDLLDRAETTCAGGVLRPGRRRHGGREQELDQDHRRGDRQLRAGLLRLRLEEVGLADDLAPALRPESDPLHLPDPAAPTSSPAISSTSSTDRRAGTADAGRDIPAQQPLRPGRGLGASAARRCSSRSSTRSCKFYVIDAYRWRARAGMGARINTIMQTCFFAISGVLPRRRRSSRSSTRSARPTARRARRSCRRTSRRSTPRSPTCTRCKVPERGDQRRSSCRRSCRPRRPNSCRRSRR